MTALGPDGFALGKFDADAGRRNIDHLIPRGAQVHFDASGAMIDLGHVLEVREIEIGIEFAVDSG